MAGDAETPNIAALAAVARLDAFESARGPDTDRHVKLLIQFAVDGHSRAPIHTLDMNRMPASPMIAAACVPVPPFYCLTIRLSNHGAGVPV